MSKKSEERKAWRKSVLEANALKRAEEASLASPKLPCPPSVKWLARSERQRLLIALLVGGGIQYGSLKLLAWLANALGIITYVQYSSSVTETHLVGKSWYSSTFTGGYTDSWHVLLVFSAAIAYWLGRSVFHGNLRASFNRRSLWLMGGWTLATALIVGELQLLLEALVRHRWLRSLNSTIFGILVLFAIGVSANIFSMFWSLLMRLRGVPRVDAFSDPDS